MLLQLENTNTENINKLLNFAKQNKLKLSVIDDTENNYFLPGKPLSTAELSHLIENSRKSGSISMEDAHAVIRQSFDAG
jgi:hypothetical protein